MMFFFYFIRFIVSWVTYSELISWHVYHIPYYCEWPRARIKYWLNESIDIKHVIIYEVETESESEN